MRSLSSVIDILSSNQHAASHRELMLILEPDVTSRPNCDERGLVRVRIQVRECSLWSWKCSGQEDHQLKVCFFSHWERKGAVESHKPSLEASSQVAVTTKHMSLAMQVKGNVWFQRGLGRDYAAVYAGGRQDQYLTKWSPHLYFWMSLLIHFSLLWWHT